MYRHELFIRLLLIMAFIYIYLVGRICPKCPLLNREDSKCLLQELRKFSLTGMVELIQTFRFHEVTESFRINLNCQFL